MIEDKGLTKEMTEVLHNFIVIKGDPQECLGLIKEKGIFGENQKGKEGLEEMELLFNYLR